MPLGDVAVWLLEEYAIRIEEFGVAAVRAYWLVVSSFDHGNPLPRI